MIRKAFFTAAIILLLGLNSAQSQTRSGATSGGAKLISGAVSFTTQGGDLYGGYSDERLNVISVTPSLFYFISPGFGVGGDLSYDLRSRGSYSYTTLSIGPKIGYFADSGSDLIPFFAGGVNYLTAGSDLGDNNGVRLKFGGGVIIRKGRLAFSIEASYLYDRLNLEGADGSTSGNTIIFGAGLAGFLFD